MPIAVREVTLDFASAEGAARWVEAHSPKGMVMGPVNWQLVLRDEDRARVRLLIGFDDLTAAEDWSTTFLPPPDGAISLIVEVRMAEAYVPESDPHEQGPGRVWVIPPTFPPTSPPT